MRTWNAFKRRNNTYVHSASYPATCPVTRQVITNPQNLVGNAKLKSEIDMWKDGVSATHYLPKKKSSCNNAVSLARLPARGRQAGDDALARSLELVMQVMCGILMPAVLKTSPLHRIRQHRSSTARPSSHLALRCSIQTPARFKRRASVLPYCQP